MKLFGYNITKINDSLSKSISFKDKFKMSLNSNNEEPNESASEIVLILASVLSILLTITFFINILDNDFVLEITLLTIIINLIINLFCVFILDAISSLINDDEANTTITILVIIDIILFIFTPFILIVVLLVIFQINRLIQWIYRVKLLYTNLNKHEKEIVNKYNTLYIRSDYTSSGKPDIQYYYAIYNIFDRSEYIKLDYYLKKSKYDEIIKIKAAMRLITDKEISFKDILKLKEKDYLLQKEQNKINMINKYQHDLNKKMKEEELIQKYMNEWSD